MNKHKPNLVTFIRTLTQFRQNFSVTLEGIIHLCDVISSVHTMEKPKTTEDVEEINLEKSMSNKWPLYFL